MVAKHVVTLAARLWGPEPGCLGPETLLNGSSWRASLLHSWSRGTDLSPTSAQPPLPPLPPPCSKAVGSVTVANNVRLVQSINIIIGEAAQPVPCPAGRPCTPCAQCRRPPAQAVPPCCTPSTSTTLSLSFAVFFITGLVLNTADVKVALKQPLGMLWGFLSILGVTPLLGFAFKEIPLTPTEFSAGGPPHILVDGVVPCLRALCFLLCSKL